MTAPAVRKARQRSALRVMPPRVHSFSRDPHIDPVAVERACHGDRVRLTIEELTVAVVKLTAAGMPAFTIAERLRISDRAVTRHRARARKLAAPSTAVDNPVDEEVAA